MTVLTHILLFFKLLTHNGCCDAEIDITARLGKDRNLAFLLGKANNVRNNKAVWNILNNTFRIILQFCGYAFICKAKCGYWIRAVDFDPLLVRLGMEILSWIQTDFRSMYTLWSSWSICWVGAVTLIHSGKSMPKAVLLRQLEDAQPCISGSTRLPSWRILVTVERC